MQKQEATLRSSRSGAGGLFSHVGLPTEKKTARSASVWLSSSMLILAWLTTAAVLLQAGTIMMAPLTALQMLLFCWLLSRAERNTPWAYWIGLLWLAALFTAYQAVLFFPLALASFLRMRLPLSYRLLLFTVPPALLLLYTLTNPLVLASMLIHNGEGQEWILRLQETGWLLVLGGSGIVTALGILGLLYVRSAAAIFSFLLVAAYVFLLPHTYYMILFTPLLFFGTVSLLRRWPRASYILLGVPIVTALLLLQQPWSRSIIDPAETIGMLDLDPARGDLLLRGTFGHEWQYASSVPVRRYHSKHLAEAQAVICLEPCEEMVRQQRWERLEDAPIEVWVRK